MIVVDSSAMLAILFKEVEEDNFLDCILEAGEVMIAAPTVLEIMIVIERGRGPATRSEIDRLIAKLSMEVVPWGKIQLAAAHDGFRRYGKGGGHPAKLNFGDCISYALARTLDAPLLYKGKDFARTDIRAAL